MLYWTNYLESNNSHSGESNTTQRSFAEIPPKVLLQEADDHKSKTVSFAEREKSDCVTRCGQVTPITRRAPLTAASSALCA